MYLANLKVLLLKFQSYIIENKTPVQFCFIHQVFYCILFCKPLSEHFKLNIVEMVTISQGHAQVVDIRIKSISEYFALTLTYVL